MNNTYHNILVGLDNSEQSEKAFEKAAEIAKQSNARLILANVIDIRQFTYALGDREKLIEDFKKFSKELLSKFETEAKNAGVEQVITVISEGSPKTKIAEDIAQTYDVDLIVCGATGYNAIERMIVGSVTENIVRHAKCDVLVVR